jgi:histidinol-phosphate aminotransferase
MAHTIEELIPEYIRGLPAYIPGRPIEEVERELKIHAIKLASNENPLGPSPKAVKAMEAALAEAHRYPDGGTHLLRAKLARLHGVEPEEIFVGLGSSEIIDLAARILLGPGKVGVTSHGTYAPFSLAIRASGAELVRVPQREFAFDLEAISDAVLAKRETRVVYLANPNNPTGMVFGMSELAAFLGRVPADVLVVLDEAYIHYAEDDLPDSLKLFREHQNLLIMRTFSKVYGLAGIRVGYGITNRGVVRAMNKLRTPFNVSGVSQAAAIAALDDREHVNRSIQENASERTRMWQGLGKAGVSFLVRSHTNFIFVLLGPEAQAISDELLGEGVIVRPLSWMGLPEAIRVSVGVAHENDKCLRAMAEVLAKRRGKPARAGGRELTAR